MKVTIDFDDATIAPIVQEHLDKGTRVQDVIEKAVRLYNRIQDGLNGDREKVGIAFTNARGYSNGRIDLDIV